MSKWDSKSLVQPMNLNLSYSLRVVPLRMGVDPYLEVKGQFTNYIQAPEQSP